MAQGIQQQQEPELIIEPGSGLVSLNLRELWQYRDLILLMTWRDVLVRYKHSILGVSWVLIQPVAMCIIFTVLFGSFAKMPSGGLPYPLLTFSGLLPWQFFQRVVSEGSVCMIGANRGIITRIYFPRLVMPVATCLPALMDLGVSLLAVLILLPFFKTSFTWQVLTVPLFILYLFLFALGPVIWSAALCAYYKDFRHIVPFSVMTMMFLSPVAYSTSIVPDQFRVLYALNPMVGIIAGFRWALLNAGTFPATELGIGFAVAVVVLYTGLQYFRQVESGMADVV